MIVDRSRFYDLEDVRRIFSEGARVTLVIRHGERFSWSMEDATFGKEIRLTEAGEVAALKFGERLNGIQDAAFGASAMYRCHRTAELIARGMGLQPEIPDVRMIGIHNPFYQDATQVLEWMKKEGALEVTLRYLQNGHEPFFVPLAEATQEFRTWLEQPRPQRFNLFVSHDSVCSQYASGLGGLREFTRENWVAYMSGILIYQYPGGEWTTCWFVPEQDAHNAFLQ